MLTGSSAACSHKCLLHRILSYSQCHYHTQCLQNSHVMEAERNHWYEGSAVAATETGGNEDSRLSRGCQKRTRVINGGLSPPGFLADVAVYAAMVHSVRACRSISSTQSGGFRSEKCNRSVPERIDNPTIDRTLYPEYLVMTNTDLYLPRRDLGGLFHTHIITYICTDRRGWLANRVERLYSPATDNLQPHSMSPAIGPKRGPRTGSILLDLTEDVLVGPLRAVRDF